MAILEILHYPDERLRRVAKPIKTFDEALQKQIDDMAETMYDAPGIGLAAVQVNYPYRLIVIDLSENKNNLLVLINPKVTQATGTQVYEEGCLSVPGIYEEVTRYEKIHVKALDRHGAPIELEAEGLLAVCIQHEIDHLDGKVFVDHLSRLKQNRVKQKLKKHPSVSNVTRHAQREQTEK